MQLARESAHNSVYVYKKGKSCSSHLRSPDLVTSEKPKLAKIDADMRYRRMSALKEEIEGIEKRLVYKQKLLLQAETAKRYDSCGGILKEVQDIKRDKRALENELHALRRKEQKAKWYQKKRQASKKQICSEADTVSDDSSTPTSQSSAQSHRSNTPLCQPSTSFRSSNPSAQSNTPSHRSSTPSSRSSTPSRQCSLFSQPRNLSHQSSTASHKSNTGYISSDDSDRPLLSPPSCSSSHLAASRSASVEILSDGDAVSFLPQPPSVEDPSDSEQGPMQMESVNQEEGSSQVFPQGLSVLPN